MSTPSLSSKEKLARLRAELSSSSEEAKRTYLADLDDCGVKWKDGRYRCNSVGCPRCTKKIIGQQQRKARSFFVDADNHDMAYLTVVGNGTRDLIEATTVSMSALIKATQYRVAASRSSCSRWDDFSAFIISEMDAVGAEHFPLLAPERRAVLAEIAPISMDQVGPTWVPSYHALVRIGRLGILEVQEAFARTWPVPGQVHLERFDPGRSVDDNIDRLVSYSLKTTCEIDIPKQMPNGRWDKVRVPWPVSWKADYFTWLHQQRNGFEFLRSRILPISSNSIKIIIEDSCNDSYVDWVEPMPILF